MEPISVVLCIFAACFLLGIGLSSDARTEKTCLYGFGACTLLAVVVEVLT